MKTACTLAIQQAIFSTHILLRRMQTMSSFYGTSPANGTAKWHPEPPGRGTFGILSSCLITMALCVWTAVHLNIPEKGQTGIFTPQMRRKIIFLLIGLFAPELVCRQSPSSCAC